MEYPRVGVGVIVQRGRHILLGQRCVCQQGHLPGRFKAHQPPKNPMSS
jgi:hypothetical protein